MRRAEGKSGRTSMRCLSEKTMVKTMWASMSALVGDSTPSCTWGGDRRRSEEIGKDRGEPTPLVHLDGAVVEACDLAAVEEGEGDLPLRVAEEVRLERELHLVALVAVELEHLLLFARELAHGRQLADGLARLLAEIPQQAVCPET